MTGIDIANAMAAYKGAARAPMSGGDNGVGAAGPSFSTLVEQAAKSALDAGYQAEKQSMAAAAGQATDITEVVTAVANAEVTLQTVVAVRDRVVQAYQEIMRMPI